MLAFILRILFLFSALLLVGRMLRRLFHALMQNAGARPGASSRSVPSRTAMVRDPMCGMYMDPRLAVRMQHKREELYFCSDECRQKYLEMR